MRASVSVLVVDDNANWRKTFRSIFADRAFRIVEAETGTDALNKISKGYFDILLIDLKLGGGCTGIEVISRAKELNLRMGAIFLVTGYPDANAMFEAFELGVFEFLEKGDVDLMDQIRTKVDEALK